MAQFLISLNKICTMKKRILFTKSILIGGLLSCFNLANAAEIRAVGGENNWNNPKAWNLNRLPKCGDLIIIPLDATILVNDQITVSTGTLCEETQLNIIGKLNFSSGKKLHFNVDAAIYLNPTGEINPSKNGGGNSELIEIGNQVFWKASEGKKNGKAFDFSTSNSEIFSSFAEEVKKNTQILELNNAQNGGTVIGKDGTKIIVKANSLLDNRGEKITGKVKIELLEVFTKADMIALNKPTVGVLPNSNKAPLISGGEMYLRISQNDSDVRTSEAVEVRVPTQKEDPNMKLFDGVMDKEGKLTWNASKEQLNLVKDDFNGDLKSSYSFGTSHWGWTNIDKFSDDPRRKTKVLVQLPEGFSPKNTSVVIAFKETLTVAELDQFDSGFFTEHYGFLPIGSTIDIISISKIGNDWIVGTKKITVIDNMQIYMDNLMYTNAVNLENILDGL